MTDLIERELELTASPAEVWQALTDPDWLSDVAGRRGRARAAARAARRSFRSATEVTTGWVEEVSPPAADDRGAGRLAFWWAQDDEPASRVELALDRRPRRGPRAAGRRDPARSRCSTSSGSRCPATAAAARSVRRWWRR